MFKEFIDGLANIFGHETVDIVDQHVTLYVPYTKMLTYDMADVSHLIDKFMASRGGIIYRIRRNDSIDQALDLEFTLKKNVHYAVWGSGERRSISDVRVLPDGREKIDQWSGVRQH